MIVKNESKNIEKCLQSVVDLVDHYVICDTGSSDGTAEVAENFLSQRGKEGKILHHEWVDFGTNRTWALDACRGRCTWAFVIDADDVVVGNMDTSMLDESVDAYRVQIENEHFSNHRVQILNMKNKNWKYKDPIHEYPCCGDRARVETLQGDYAWRAGVHGCRAQEAGGVKAKYLKDYILIKNHLLKNPDNSRMRFYLGQSAFDAGEYELAEEAYLGRVSMGGWRDEAFYSWYKISICRERKGEECSMVLDACMHAIELDCERAEPYVQASRTLRAASKPISAYVFARAGMQSRMDLDKLFVHKDCYLWQIQDEVGSTAFYARQIDDGRSACRQLLDGGRLPPEHMERVMNNLKFYE